MHLFKHVQQTNIINHEHIKDNTHMRAWLLTNTRVEVHVRACARARIRACKHARMHACRRPFDIMHNRSVYVGSRTETCSCMQLENRYIHVEFHELDAMALDPGRTILITPYRSLQPRSGLQSFVVRGKRRQAVPSGSGPLGPSKTCISLSMFMNIHMYLFHVYGICPW